MTTAYINRIATATPPHDVHRAFVRFATAHVETDRERRLFERLASKAQISHRYSVLPPGDEPEVSSVDGAGFYRPGAFPSTARRMDLYAEHAPRLGAEAVERLELGQRRREVTHLVVTSCTGMYAPGLDFDLIDRCGLRAEVERTMVGFMGCYAAVNGLKLAHHIVRSTPAARVLLVNLELCSLHMQQWTSFEQLLSFLLFADGCAASLISADPEGLAIDDFRAVALPDSRSLIQWSVGDQGFEMFLSGQVPATIARGMEAEAASLLGPHGCEGIDEWAVHPGGRTVLDAVERGLDLDDDQLGASREVLDRFGNMSSASIMFVLASIMRRASRPSRGLAMSFGPGLVAETMTFHGV